MISLCPSNTEFVTYLGLTSSLVAVDDYSDWPKEVEQLPRVGPDLSIDMDVVEKMKPDLVLASLSVPGMEKNIEQLEDRNIPHIIVSNPKSLTEVAEVLRNLGNDVGRKEVAEHITDRFHQILKIYRTLSMNVEEKKSIYWEWWPKPVFTPGQDSWLTEMSELAGGYNVFAQEKKASVQTDWANVLEKQPDVIAAIWVGVRQDHIKPKLIKQRPGWADMRAIVNNQLYILEEPFFCRPSPRLLIGLIRIASLLHPNHYPSLPLDQDPLLNDEMFNMVTNYGAGGDYN
nr:cobalamin-binding protein [Texcoconibacillus texcoconensis]